MQLQQHTLCIPLELSAHVIISLVSELLNHFPSDQMSTIRKMQTM